MDDFVRKYLSRDPSDELESELDFLDFSTFFVDDLFFLDPELLSEESELLDESLVELSESESDVPVELALCERLDLDFDTSNLEKKNKRIYSRGRF